MITFILANLKSIGVGLAFLFGINLIKKNQNLKQENKEINKLVDIQQKVIDAKHDDKIVTSNDVINSMLNDKE